MKEGQKLGFPILCSLESSFFVYYAVASLGSNISSKSTWTHSYGGRVSCKFS